MTPRPGLDPGKVVRAAAEIIQTEGYEALSLSRVAKRLGVRIPSLYNHVAGLAGLQRDLALLSVRALGERLNEAALGRSGPQAVMAMAQAYRDFVKQSPGLYRAGVRSISEAPDAELDAARERVAHVVLAVIGSFGLQGAEAVHAVRGLRSLAHGFATLEMEGGFGMPLDCDESYRRLVETFIAGLEKSGG